MRAITILILLVLTIPTKAQENLVINGSFEDYISCPQSYSELPNCSNWVFPTLGSSDYFNSCSSGSVVSVPTSFTGTCPAKDGNAYVGGYFCLMANNDFYVEYIQGQTSRVLESGKRYKLSMSVSLASISNTAISEIGVYFSAEPVTSTSAEPLSLVPQCTFHKPDFFTTIGDWMYVETTFTAQGGEKHLTIGNFKSASAIDTLSLSANEAPTNYMLVDDVVLIEIGGGIGVGIEAGQGLEEPEEEPKEPAVQEAFIPNVFTPNGDGTNDVWKLILPDYETHTVSIFNRWGEQLYQASVANFFWNGETPNGSPCTEGVYYYRVSDSNISGFFELFR